VRLSLERKISIGFALAFIVVVLTGVFAWGSAARFKATTRLVGHTHQVLFQIEATLTDLLTMQTATRGFLLTSNDEFLTPYQNGRDSLARSGDALRSLLADNPIQQARLTESHHLIAQLDALMTHQIANYRRGAFDPRRDHASLTESDALMTTLRATISGMENHERSLLTERSSTAQAQSARSLVFITGVSVLAGGLVVTAGLLVRRDLRRRAEADLQIQQLNAELTANNQRLEITNQELEAFSYSVSHDLRAPLRHITGFASLLERKAGATLEPQSKHYVATIVQAGVRMGQLIDDLLAFSRIGRSSLQPTVVTQSDLIERVIAELKSEYPTTQWTVGPLPPVHVDNAMLRQVWFNLLDNAAKYSRKSPAPTVEVGHRIDETLDEHLFWIRDNGVGFDMAYVDKLFGVFSRLHSVDEFEGTGIGLALVRRIVSRHGGRTWAEGRLGEGAIFFFTLPIRATRPSP
jgi:signal transduction histidine kinase